MSLITATRWSLYAVGWFFISRTVATVHRELLLHLPVALAVQAVSVCAGAVLLLFFVTLFKKYAAADQKLLRAGTLAGVAGSGLMLLVQLRGLLQVVGVLQPGPGLLASFAGLGAAACSAVFFLLFCLHFRSVKSGPATAAGLAAAVSLLSMAARGWMAWSYFAGNVPAVRPGGLLSWGMIALVPLTFLATLYFLAVFYRSLPGSSPAGG